MPAQRALSLACAGHVWQLLLESTGALCWNSVGTGTGAPQGREEQLSDLGEDFHGESKAMLAKHMRNFSWFMYSFVTLNFIIFLITIQ